MPYTVSFGDSDATQHDLVGRKGANLARLTQAGFVVPPGFVVTTQAYTEFLRQTGLEDQLRSLIPDFAYGDADMLEKQTSHVRELIREVTLPEDISREILAGYAAAGSGDSVTAVRSSGVAEDLADASFAGQHDTYLGIQGADNVLDAVQRCWASLWTARATSYRDTKGFDHFESVIAVVVQELVDSDVAGVLFAGNPMTGANDELIINASWGLGEAVVSGIATPDQLTVSWDTLAVRERMLGSKTVQIVRDLDTGGTREEEVIEADRARFSISDDQAAALGELGRRVTEYYRGIPQDIEWCLKDGQLYLLQSRPITGAGFSWDHDVDAWQQHSEEPDTIWTRSWADEVWSGAISPLMYSWRTPGFELAYQHSWKLWGIPQGSHLRQLKYYKGVPYYNTSLHKLQTEVSLPPMFRQGLLTHVHPDQHADTLRTPLPATQLLRTHLRILALAKGESLHKWIELQETVHLPKLMTATDLSNEELARLSDRELIRYTDDHVQIEHDYYRECWAGYFLHIPLLTNVLDWMVANWYDGGNDHMFVDLNTGAPTRTHTQKENAGLWALSRSLRNSPTLRTLFENSDQDSFFTDLGDNEEGRRWLATYTAWWSEHQHRGHADRDMYYIRRGEDRGVDYRALQGIMSVDDDHDPELLEAVSNTRRETAVAEFIENARRKPLGALKVEAFKLVHHHLMLFAAHRDDERYCDDFHVYMIKKAYQEIGRRCVARGRLETERDHYFLTREELYTVLNGVDPSPELTRAKITGRAANFDAINAREADHPMYLQNNKELVHELPDDDGHLRGVPTSRGRVTGTARIIPGLDQIGRLRKGDILICNATDPGWTPAFLTVRGVIAETGGLLAHFSCLSREYGMPAIQMASAMKRITDGATITMDGATGEVIVHDDEPTPDTNGTVPATTGAELQPA